MGGFFKLIFSGLFLFVLFTIVLALFNMPSQSQRQEPKPVNPKQQQHLAELIQGYTDHGVIDKIDYSNDVPHIYVNKLFNVLKVGDKSTVIGVVFYYYQNQNPRVLFVSILDAYSGKRVGKYSQFGLEME